MTRFPLGLGVLCVATCLLAGCSEASTADGGAPTGDVPMPDRDANPPTPPLSEATWTTHPIALDGAPLRVTSMAFVPGRTNELLVAQLDGNLLHYRLGEDDTTELLGTLALPDIYMELDCGLLSVAFDPDYASNKRLYYGHCLNTQQSRIARIPFDADAPVYELGADDVVEIFRAGDDRAARPWHNLGSIGFDPSGALFALFGDKTVLGNSEDPTNVLGALLRMQPGEAGGATPAADNPFVDGVAGDPMVYAYGLRSPWMGFADLAGNFWVGDVGEDDAEELNLINAPALNFGWHAAEGPCRGECAGLTDPIIFWGHDDEDPFIFDDLDAEPLRSRVAWAGLRYQQPSTDRYAGELDDKVLYGDMCLGFVRALSITETGALANDAHLMHVPFATAWRLGPDGYIYAVTFDGRCTTDGDASYGTARLLRIVREP